MERLSDELVVRPTSPGMSRWDGADDVADDAPGAVPEPQCRPSVRQGDRAAARRGQPVAAIPIRRLPTAWRWCPAGQALDALQQPGPQPEPSKHVDPRRAPASERPVP